jgi:hypothetical protein
LAEVWQERTPPRVLAKALGILREKFAAVNAFGPQQVVEFHNSANAEERAMQARRAYELVQEFLRRFG